MHYSWLNLFQVRDLNDVLHHVFEMLLLFINDLQHAIYRSHFIFKWSHMTQTSVLEITRANAPLNGQPITSGMTALPREVTRV